MTTFYSGCSSRSDKLRLFLSLHRNEWKRNSLQLRKIVHLEDVPAVLDRVYVEIVTWQVALREDALPLPARSTVRVEEAMAYGACAAVGSSSPNGDTNQWPT